MSASSSNRAAKLVSASPVSRVRLGMVTGVEDTMGVCAIADIIDSRRQSSRRPSPRLHFPIPQGRPGAAAAIIALEGDPLPTIKALENVPFVMKDGKVFNSEIQPLADCARAERRFLVPAQG